MKIVAKLTAAVLLPIAASACVVLNMPGRSFDGPLPPASPEQAEACERLRGHVVHLAGTLGERNTRRHEPLEGAARYIRESLEAVGYEVDEQPFEAPGFTFTHAGETVAARTVRNLEARIEGSGSPTEVVIVGAHYDSALNSPGADDNASGVASLLELARTLHGSRLGREVRFVFFANEEAPFFGGKGMGSFVYAQRCKDRGERVTGMLSLETIGYYDDAKKSQDLPVPLRPFFPSRGNFVAFVTDYDSRDLLRQTVRGFRQSVEFPSRGGAVPRRIEGVDWSDHWSFWEMGYPALMVTDTAFLRNPHYHTLGDTPETLDFDRLARVVEGLGGAVQELAR